MKTEQKERLAERLARALADSFNRTGEVPSETDLRDAIRYLLDDPNISND